LDSNKNYRDHDFGLDFHLSKKIQSSQAHLVPINISGKGVLG